MAKTANVRIVDLPFIQVNINYSCVERDAQTFLQYSDILCFENFSTSFYNFVFFFKSDYQRRTYQEKSFKKNIIR